MSKRYNINDLTLLIQNKCGANRAVLLEKFIEDLGKPFEDAPASSSVHYHEAYPGGLIDHIMKFINFGEGLAKGVPGITMSLEEIVTVAVLHDIHKVRDAKGNAYYLPNILKSGKQSDTKPYERNEAYFKYDSMEERNKAEDTESSFLSQYDPYTGGQHSLALVYTLDPDLYLSLSDDEKQAILYHSGAYEGNPREMGGKESVLQIICHAADMLASRMERHANKES